MNIAKTIFNFITFEFQFIRQQSVASITANLTKTVAALEAHAADQIEKAKEKAEAAAKALKERVEHEEEVVKASKVAQNIKALLG